MSDHDEYAVAIIGMSGRFPGAAGVEEYWNNLLDGVTSIRALTDEELDSAGVGPATRAHPRYVRVAAPVDNADLFDAAFFGYTPVEAEIIDPQQRLFLECAWEALEIAGYDPGSYPGKVGVFGGSGFSMYLVRNLLPHGDRPDGDRPGTVGRLEVGIGNDRDSFTSRVSYKLGLTGPSVNVQAFCSTSLVAVHLACQSLLMRESDLVLAGGAEIDIPQTAGYLPEEGDIRSPSGRCRSFDARADGTVIGNGAGVVVLKRLPDAVADRDHIVAVIRGSAVNNDGRARAAYTGPGVDGQAAVIADAMANADVEPETIGYVECHATGTPLGDAVELEAMARAFSGLPPGSCLIGTIKPSVGHLDRVSGVAGLIKTALALDREILPGTLGFDVPNPVLDLDAGPFRVHTEPRPWPRCETPRRAGVSSFGLGGTNAHVVLEEAPELPVTGPVPGPHLLMLSAKTSGALGRVAERLSAHLARHPDLDLADVAYTLGVSRTVHRHRAAVVCVDTADAVAALHDPTRLIIGEQTRRARATTLVFPAFEGWPAGVVEELRRAEPAFATAVEECARFGDAPEPFVAQYALGRLLLDWGIGLDAGIRIGGGQYVADCLGGLPMEKALAAAADAITASDQAGPTTEPAAGSLHVIVGTVELLPAGWSGESIPALRPGGSAVAALRELAGRLWLAGADLDWGRMRAGGRRRVPLPPYPFERRRFWVDPPKAAPSPAAEHEEQEEVS